ncbi:MAG: 30S ribosomal protein S2 [Candidatus Falkowbacteria bacterium]
MKVPTIEEMLKAGMHFGHRTAKWHPKMKPYIFGARKGIYIMDLDKAQASLERALQFMSDTVANNQKILLVGTKAQAKGLLKKVGQETGMPYISEHWLGGTMTNFTVIKKSIRKYRDLIEKKAAGKLARYTKKEQLEFDRDIIKLEKSFGGLTDLNTIPDAIFIWDIRTEKTALAEAKKRGLTIIAVCDTNVNPTGIDYVVPANDDASKTIKLVMEAVREAILDGKERAEANKARTAKQVPPAAGVVAEKAA